MEPKRKIRLKIATKKALRKSRKALNFSMAERVGFEPTVPFGTIDFESITFDHSDTSPLSVNQAKLYH